MYYLLLGFLDRADEDSFSAGERAAYERACLANDADLREKGYLLAAARVDTASPAAVLQVRDEELAFNQLEEGELDGRLLVSLHLIHARDLNEAVRLAAQMPQARRGAIQVRVLLDGDAPLQLLDPGAGPPG